MTMKHGKEGILPRQEQRKTDWREGYLHEGHPCKETGLQWRCSCGQRWRLEPPKYKGHWEIENSTATIILSGNENKLKDDLNNINIHDSILDYDTESVKDMEVDDAGNDDKTASEEKDKNNKKEGDTKEEPREKTKRK